MARHIDADALKERIEKLKVVPDDLFGMGITRGIERVETTIDMLPAADVVEVKRGRWKGAGLGDYLCSRCQEVYSGGNNFTYCPCCGAKMDGGEK